MWPAACNSGVFCDAESYSLTLVTMGTTHYLDRL